MITIASHNESKIVSPAYINDTMGDGLSKMGKANHSIIWIKDRPYVLHKANCGCNRPNKVKLA